MAGRLAAGRGLASLTVLALLASITSTCHLPGLSSLQWTSRGKPRFRDGPEISFTHSRGIAACAVAPRGVPVGIDIEPAGRASAAAIHLAANPDELCAIEAGAFSPTGLWTAKEAVLKAAGACLADIRRVALRPRDARLAGVDYEWRHLEPRAGLLLAVATRGPLPVVRIVWPTPGSIFG